MNISSTMEEARQYYIIGDNLRHKGFYEDAITEFERALFIQEPLVGPMNIHTGKTHYALGLAKKAVKKYRESLSHLQKALKSFEYTSSKDNKENKDNTIVKKGKKKKGGKQQKQVHPNHELIIACKLNIARTHHCQGVDFQRSGDYDNSIIEHQKAKALREAYLGKNNMETARTYYVLGCALSDRGDFDEALAELRRALKVRMTVMGEHHLDTVEVMDNIGTVLYARSTSRGTVSTDTDTIQEYIKGGKLSKSIHLECDGETYASGSSSTTTTTNQQQVDHIKALECFREALRYEEELVGELHPTTCDLHLSIADSLGASDELEASLQEYKTAIGIYEQLLGKFHVKIATIYSKLALILMTRGEYETALSFFCKAYGIYDSTLGNHPDTSLALKRVRQAAEKERNAMNSMAMLKTVETENNGTSTTTTGKKKKKKKNDGDTNNEDII